MKLVTNKIEVLTVLGCSFLFVNGIMSMIKFIPDPVLPVPVHKWNAIPLRSTVSQTKPTPRPIPISLITPSSSGAPLTQSEQDANIIIELINNSPSP